MDFIGLLKTGHTPTQSVDLETTPLLSSGDISIINRSKLTSNNFLMLGNIIV